MGCTIIKPKHSLFYALMICIFGFLAFEGGKAYVRQNGAHVRFLPVDAVVTSVKDNCRHHSCMQILYSYQVGGQSYKGSRYAFVSDGGQYEERLARYPLNGHVTAYYDPDDPANAVLDNSAWPVFKLIKMFFSAVLFVGVWVVVTRFVQRRARNNNRSREAMDYGDR